MKKMKPSFFVKVKRIKEGRPSYKIFLLVFCLLTPLIQYAQTKKDQIYVDSMYKMLLKSRDFFDSSYKLMNKMVAEAPLEVCIDLLRQALTNLDSCIRSVPEIDSLIKIKICPEYTFHSSSGKSEYKSGITKSPKINYRIFMEELKLLREDVNTDYQSVKDVVEKNSNRWGNWSGPTTYSINETETIYMNFINDKGFPSYFEYFDILKTKIKNCLKE